jgi:hypothetical protein
LNETADTAPWQPFRVTLAYTDADMEAYQRVVERRYAGSTSFWRSWGALIPIGFVVGLIGASVTTTYWTVRGQNIGVMALLFFAVYWLGASPRISWEDGARSRRARLL